MTPLAVLAVRACQMGVVSFQRWKASEVASAETAGDCKKHSETMRCSTACLCLWLQVQQHIKTHPFIERGQPDIMNHSNFSSSAHPSHISICGNNLLGGSPHHRSCGRGQTKTLVGLLCAAWSREMLNHCKPQPIMMQIKILRKLGNKKTQWIVEFLTYQRPHCYSLSLQLLIHPTRTLDECTTALIKYKLSHICDVC